MTSRVAVLVLNWNGWRDTVECLESLFRLEHPDLTVVLCDNASMDGSLDRIRAWANGEVVDHAFPPAALRSLVHPPAPKPIPTVELGQGEAEEGPGPTSARLVLIKNDRNDGFAGGTNVGLRYLLTQPFDHVWILNNDIIVASDSLTRLLQALERESAVGAVAPTLYEYHDPDTIQAAGGGVFRPWRGFPRTVTPESGIAEPGKPVALDYIAGGCMVAPLSLIARVGVFDERFFMYGEDVELSHRIVAAGFSLRHVPEARVWHKGGASIGYRTARHDYYAVRNNLFLFKQLHRGLLPVAFAHAAYTFVLPKLMRRQWRRLAAVWQATLDFSRGVMGPLPAASPINKR